MLTGISLGLQATQKLALTPQLREALRVLQLPAVDLRAEVAEALEQNPLLETEDDFGEEAQEFEGQLWHPAEDNYIDLAEAPRTLTAVLLEQLACTRSDLKIRSAAEWLIGSLDENGFLTESIEEIAADCPFTASLTSTDWVCALRLVQSFEPNGVAARNQIDSLVLQLASIERSRAERPEIVKLAKTIVQEHLTLLARHDLAQLRKALGCHESSLRQACDLITSLNPRPAASFSGSEAQCVIPEIRVALSLGRWQAHLIESPATTLRVNLAYANAIQSLKEDDTWRQKLSDARSLVRSIAQRHQTLLKIASSIVEFQQDFFSLGPQGLKPMVLRQIAEQVQIHESTVSRATHGKYLTCPQGTFELKYFFSSSIHSDGQEASSVAIKAHIKRIISAENPAKPLSDAKIASELEQAGFTVARRTVSKYREALGIAPTSERKRL